MQSWGFWQCWVMRNISIQLCLKELCTYSKSSFHSLILPAMKYPDNSYVCIILKSKMKPVFNTYFFHSYEYHVCILLISPWHLFLWRFSHDKREFWISTATNRYSDVLYCICEVDASESCQLVTEKVLKK